VEHDSAAMGALVDHRHVYPVQLFAAALWLQRMTRLYGDVIGNTGWPPLTKDERMKKLKLKTPKVKGVKKMGMPKVKSPKVKKAY
jgi:hypothetical protein